jgi:hypothetical protein
MHGKVLSTDDDPNLRRAAIKAAEQGMRDKKYIMVVLWNLQGKITFFDRSNASKQRPWKGLYFQWSGWFCSCKLSNIATRHMHSCNLEERFS